MATPNIAALALVALISCADPQFQASGVVQEQVSAAHHAFRVLAKDGRFAVVQRLASIEVYRRSVEMPWVLCGTTRLPDDWRQLDEVTTKGIASREELISRYTEYFESNKFGVPNAFLSNMARPRPLVLGGLINVEDARCVAVEGRYAVVVLDADLSFLDSDGDCGWEDRHRPWMVIFRADDEEWLLYDEVWLQSP